MAATSVGVNWMEILLVLLSGGGLLGMPPGDRDPALIKAAPQQSLVYLEWASRGAGQPGAPGIDGFAADPEVRELVAAIEKALAPTDVSGEEEFQQSPRDALRLAGLLTAHSGCLFVVADPPREGNGLLAVPVPAEILSRFHAALIVNAGADASAIIEAINRVSHQEIPLNPQRHEVAGPMNGKVTIHQEKGRLIIGFGEGTVDIALAGLQGKTPGLDTNPRFTANWSKVKVDRVGSVCWLDLKGTAEVTTQSLGPAGLVAQAIIKGAGADALDCVTSATGVVDGQVIQRTFIATEGRTDGVLMLAKGPALKLEQLSHIPADSELVVAGSLDIGQLVAGTRDLLARTNPLMVKVFDEGARELEAELHLNINKDVVPAFGNAWTAFSSPSEGGMLGSSLIVAIEVRDRAKAKTVYETLMQLVEQSLASSDPAVGSTTELHRHEFLGQTICHVSRQGWSYGVAPSMVPTFCLTDTHMLFAVHPQAMKAHLRYRTTPRPGFDKIAKTKLSLANQDLLFASYSDGVRSTQILAGLVPFIGESLADMAQGSGVEFDSFTIPSIAALAPYAGDVALSVARQKDGLLLESRNPQIGIAVLAAMGWTRTWLHGDYEVILESRRQRHQAAVNVALGAPALGAPALGAPALGAPAGQVVPAAAVAPAVAVPAPVVAVPKEEPAAAVARRAAPIVIRALVPENVQPMIPPDVFRILAEPPTPEMLQRREERRKEAEARRKELEERRRLRTQQRNLPPPPRPQ